MSFLLDTNVLSELRKPRPDAGVLAWFETVTSRELHVSVLVLGEIRQGIERLRLRDPARAAGFEQWLDTLRRDFADRLLPVSEAVALEWGRLASGPPLPVIDGLLAATAQAHGLTLVTRNIGDFARTGVATLNPFRK